MKFRFSLIPVSTAAVVALLSYNAPQSRAISADSIQYSTVTPASPFQEVRLEDAKADILRRAYHLLERADQDYRGHKGKALANVKAAAELLGVDLHGHEEGNETQGKSDTQMHQAKTLLKSLLDDTHGAEHAHIERAVEQIDLALDVK